MNAKERIMKRNTIAKAFTIAAFTAVALGLGPLAKASDKGCSNASLKGTFADKDTGFITAPPAMAGPFAGVSVETFDGNGGFTATGMASINGNLVASTGKGTYTVNPDCTGSITAVISPLGITTHTFFVIDDSLNELQMLVTDPGLAVTCIARRQFPAGDWRQ